MKLYGATTTCPVTVVVSAQPGSDQLLNNILTAEAGLLNVDGVSGALDTVLSRLVTLATGATLSVTNPATRSASVPAVATVPVLDAYIAPVYLNLRGALVATSPIHLQIIDLSDPGLLLGNIVAELANLLNNLTGNRVADIETGLTGLLNPLDAMDPGILTSVAAGTQATPPAGTDRVMSLTVPPLDLYSLGLIPQTSTVQVIADARSGNGELLGNLISDVLNTVNIKQTDIATINAAITGVLGQLIGLLNASTLALASNATASLSTVFEELLSPTLVDTTGATVPAEPVLNLSIASNDGDPPVDVDERGLVILTSNINVNLLAQPGHGEVLGNLVSNVSHRLDGGSLGLMSILNGLGV